jgi:chromosome partitioning protein
MAIIVVATTKGGSGKSTLAACLATYWSNGQGDVEALDTDPNRNLLARLSGTGIPCSSVDEEAILPIIGEASKRSELVIVDVAGTLARGLLYAVSAADIVLIPCRPDRNDVVEAVRTQEVIRQAEAMTRRKIPHAAVLSQVNRKAVVTTQTRTQLDALGVPYLIQDIPARTAYQQASYTGSPLTDDLVREDIKALAIAVNEMMGMV